jgi:hypothetical protein
MRWAGHIAHTREKRYIQGFVGKLKEWDHLVDLGIDGRRVLKWILNKQGMLWIVIMLQETIVKIVVCPIISLQHLLVTELQLQVLHHAVGIL